MPKIQIYIKDLSIKNIPSRSNRIFLKLKSGRKCLITKKHLIDQNNSVVFENIIAIQNTVKKTKKGNKLEKVRFSFRIESSNGVEFTRYGSFNITDLDYDQVKYYPYHICRSLERCKENPQIECKIIVAESSKNLFNNDESKKNSNELKQEQSEPVFYKSTLVSPNNEISSKSDPCRKNQQLVLNIDKNSNSYSISSFSLSSATSTTIPLNITEEKYNEIEDEIDNLLAEIINA